jgi:hypothetical protein
MLSQALTVQGQFEISHLVLAQLQEKLLQGYSGPASEGQRPAVQA